MKKYMIFAVPRTGSTLYANLLSRYYNHTMQNQDPTACYTSIDGVPDWSLPIQHTHQLSVLSATPDDYVRLMPTRSLLDSIISQIIADRTATWTMATDQDEVAYTEQFRDAKFCIDVEDFFHTVQAVNSLYVKAFAVFDRCETEKHLLEYNTHAKDYTKFFAELNIDYELPEPIWPHLPPPRWVNSKMPVDKFTMISNLQQVLDAYRSVRGMYNFNDDVTIRHVETIIKEQQ